MIQPPAVSLTSSAVVLQPDTSLLSTPRHVPQSSVAEPPPTQHLPIPVPDLGANATFPAIPRSIDSELTDLLLGGIPASPLFPSFPELVVPDTLSPQARSFERTGLSALRRGFVVPRLRFADDFHPSFAELDGFEALYVVVVVHPDGSADLSRLSLYPQYALGSHPTSPAWASFSAPLEDRSILVMSAFVLDSLRLPSDARAALALLRIAPCAPSMTRPTPPDLPPAVGSHSSDASRGSQLREFAAAPLKRALHGDVSVFSSLVGPSGDISSKMFLNNLRNLQTSAQLHRLPFFSPDNLESFITFRWGKELSFTSRKADVCHLSLFRLPDTQGNVLPFRSVYDINTALLNLESACVTLFLERSDRPFFSRIFVQLQKRYHCMDMNLSVSSLNIDFLVWKLSEILVRWSSLFLTELFANAPFAEFLDANVAILDFDPLLLKSQAVTVDPRLLPRQYGASDFFLPRRPSEVSAGGSFRSPSSKRPPPTGSSPPAKTPKVPSPAPGAPPSTSPSSKGKYICVTDHCHQFDPVTFSACPRGASCSLRHEPKPSSGRIAPAVRTELLTSVAAMRNLPGSKRSQLTAFLSGLP